MHEYIVNHGDEFFLSEVMHWYVLTERDKYVRFRYLSIALFGNFEMHNFIASLLVLSESDFCRTPNIKLKI